MAKFGDLLKEARRRRVYRGAALYVVGAWVVLQVADLAFETWGLPQSALRYVWVAAILGFPIALIFAWLYEITPHGIVRTLPGQADDDLSLKRTDYVILSALLLVGAAISFGLVGQIRTIPEAESPTGTLRKIHPNSIAVLPLDNLSGDSEQAYFVESMHDSLITSLSQIGDLRVTSRISAIQADTDQPAPAIARELGVAHFIEGSVFWAGDQVQVNLQLIDAEQDAHLWAQTYEYELADVFALLNEISRAVAQQVHVKLTERDDRRLANAHRVDPRAFELYQQGVFQQRAAATFEDIDRAIELLERAVEIDPGFARAWAALGNANDTYRWWGIDSEEHAIRADEATNEALRIDPNLAEAYLAIRVPWEGGENFWENDRRRVLRALEMNPSLAEAHRSNAWQLWASGQVQESIAAIERALELDPLNIELSTIAFAPYYAAREWERALEQLDESRKLEPEQDASRQIFYGRVLAQLGRYEDALAAYANAVGQFDTENVMDVWTHVLIAQTHAMAGQNAAARERLDMILARPQSDAPPIGMAMVLAILGETETALDHAAQGCEARDPMIVTLRTEPSFDSLRSHPRFQSLLARECVPQPVFIRSSSED